MVPEGLNKGGIMYDTHQKGEVAFLKCSLRAVERGCVISRPTMESRYDAILDEDGRLFRVQVKYGDGNSQCEGGAVNVDFRRKTTSTYAKRRPYTAKEIDLMLVYVPKIDKVLRFEASHFDGKQSLRIRIEPTKNGQKIGVIDASDYVW